MTGSMFASFLVCLAGMLALGFALYHTELAGKRLDARPARAPEGARVTTAEKYVTAAYLVVLAVVLLYVVIYSFRMARLSQELAELAERAQPGAHRARPRGDARRDARRLMGEAALLLVWPAVFGYAEAALAYVGETIRPGRLGRYAIWGVRLGWLAQTALLVAQAVGRGRVPVGLVGRLAESLRLDVRRRVPDLGLPRAVPAARAGRDAARGRAARARLGGGRRRAPTRAPTSAASFSRSTSASSSPRSPASLSPPLSRPSTCGRTAG